MSEHNGAHLNGHTPLLPSPGGEGGLLVERNRGVRQDVRMIQRGMTEGWLKPWQLDPKLAESLPRSIGALVNSDDDRTAIRAAGVLVQMAKYNLALVEAVDNAGRLNDGDATERIEIVYRKPERVIVDE